MSSAGTETCATERTPLTSLSCCRPRRYLVRRGAKANLVACVTAPARWEPDTQLVPAVLSSPKAARRMADLTAPDRAWLVAGLTLAGLTAKDIADRLGCSLRLVRSIRAEPSTQVCLVAQLESRNFADELRLERSEHQVTRRELSEVQAEAERIKGQLDRVLDARMIGETVTVCRKCGYVLDKWNVYEHAKTGKKACRNCHRTRVNEWRSAKRLGVTLQEYRASAPADQIGVTTSVSQFLPPR